jgi:segregation and condensation protein B
MEAGWIKPATRREVPGRPVTWLTTQAFLDHFGLEALTDLPGAEELKAAGLLDKRPAIEAMPASGDLFDEAQEGIEPEITDEDLVGRTEASDGEDSNEEVAEDEEDFDDEDEDDLDDEDDEDDEEDEE